MPAAHTHTHKIVQHGNLLLRMLQTHEGNDRRHLHDVDAASLDAMVDDPRSLCTRCCCSRWFCCCCLSNSGDGEHNTGAILRQKQCLSLNVYYTFSLCACNVVVVYFRVRLNSVLKIVSKYQIQYEYIILKLNDRLRLSQIYSHSSRFTCHLDSLN